MNRIRLNRKPSVISAVMVMLAASFLIALTTSPLTAATSRKDQANNRDGDRDKYLFVWAGDQARTAPDFLTVVDFDERSPHYGSVITTLALPGPGASGNEPHHVGLSRDGRVLACGGLLSVLKGQSEIFFFDATHHSHKEAAIRQRMKLVSYCR